MDESAWWTVSCASKNRSEGEKVRVNDDIILSSVSSERYLHLSNRFDTNIIEETVEKTTDGNLGTIIKIIKKI